jgi:cell division septation protein DedD
VIGPDAAEKADEAPYTGSIRINLKHPANAAANDYSLLFAAAQNILGLGLCVAKTTPTCTVGGEGYFGANLIYNDGTKNFFMPKNVAHLEDGLILTVVGSDATGQIVDTRNVKFSGGTAAATATQTSATTPTATTPTTPATTTPAATTPPTVTPTTTTPTATPGGSTGGTTGTQSDFGGGGAGW